jgi:hypothetical protein
MVLVCIKVSQKVNTKRLEPETVREQKRGLTDHPIYHKRSYYTKVSNRSREHGWSIGFEAVLLQYQVCMSSNEPKVTDVWSMRRLCSTAVD